MGPPESVRRVGLARAFPEVTCHLVVSDPDGGGTAVLSEQYKGLPAKPL